MTIDHTIDLNSLIMQRLSITVQHISRLFGHLTDSKALWNTPHLTSVIWTREQAFLGGKSGERYVCCCISVHFETQRSLVTMPAAAATGAPEWSCGTSMMRTPWSMRLRLPGLVDSARSGVALRPLRTMPRIGI